MEISAKLIHRIFRDALKSGEAVHVSEELPDNLPFKLPLFPAATVIGAIIRGELSYDFIFKSPSTAVTIQAFYLNTLRIVGWQRWYAPEERTSEPLGVINTSSSRRPLLQFCHPQTRYFLQLRTVEAIPPQTETIFHIKVVAAIYQSGAEPLWRQFPVNAAPIPVLLPPSDTKVRDGQSGGNHFTMHGLRTLQSPQTVAELIGHFTEQLHCVAQLEESNTSAELAYTLWSLTDAAGESWQLFFCIAATSLLQQYASILRVDSVRGIPRSQPLSPIEVSDDGFSPEQITVLLEALHPEAAPALLWGQLPSLPVPLPLFPPPAQILGSLITHKQWRIFLDMPGAAKQVFADLTKQLSIQGWELADSPAPFEAIGFADSGLYPLVPARFYHSEYKSYPLSVWSRPSQSGWIDVELAIQEEEQSSNRHTNSNIHERERPQYPALKLELPPESVVYSGEGAYHPRRCRTSVQIQTALSQADLVAHYNAQMTNAGWTQQTHQCGNRLCISSWITASANQDTWQGLLWVVKESTPNAYSAHLQINCLYEIA